MAETSVLNPSPPTDNTPALSEIRSWTQSIFGIRPCLWQLQVASGLLNRGKDVVCIAGMGMGKTLTFWMPLLFRPDGVQIVVTPLNLLGKQNVASLAKAGIRAIAINTETATTINFRHIRTLQYRAIIVSPEQIMKPGSEFEKLLKDTSFMSHIISIVIDEAHCLTEWGEFRPLVNYADLAFLIPDGFKIGDPPPPKFLVFFDDIADSINAVIALRQRFPKALRNRIKWFNADMSNTYKVNEVNNLVSGDTWGLCTTSSFGMGMDVPDISLVVQWRATCSLASLWQRFGRAVRNKELTGTAILLAEKDYFDDERAAKAARKVKRAAMRKRKANEANLPQKSPRPSKRRMPLEPGPSSASGQRNLNTQDLKSGTGNTPGLGESTAVLGDGDISMVGTADIESDSESIEGESAEVDEGVMQATTPEPGVKELTEAMEKREYSFGHVHQVKRQKRALDVGLDFLINAGNRSGVMCRRKVFDICFDNAAADSDHLECDTTANPHSCSRCQVILPPPITCCDIHNPAAFMLPLPVKLSSATSQCSRLPPGPYSKDKYDYKLDEVLQDWREAKTIEVYGWAKLSDYGPSLVMTDAILDRIIDCAHYHKFEATEDIEKETGWVDSGLYGQEIFDKIKEHAAPRPTLFVSTPLRHDTLLTQPTNIMTCSPIQQTRTRELSTIGGERHNRCSRCKQEGHNSRNKACPEHPSRLQVNNVVNKENILQ